MRAKKVDKTQPGIVTALRAAGVSVFSIAPVGNNVPDLVCSYRGFTALAECKTGDAKLRTGQQDFKKTWQGTVIVARSGEEAVREFFKAWSLDRLQKI